ncbi:MAG: single-stranded DNA-binding protein [Rhodobacteraceae bacterium]|nr:single-stranded DNA-binding protein [Paracoccaceae bacterium]MCY4197806.1 single-stranded DNA-binding protein [Paracoccaceae bacterium]MCY4326150.1 single-stranded DNA-binding protein [Paracoccaceae bacterium]
MVGSVNKVILLGNLGADPETREFPSGAQYCRLRIATSERWTDRNSGEKREKTQWHNVTIYADGLVKVVQQYLHKGEKVYIEGTLETRKWQDQNGEERYTTEVAVRGFGGTMVLLGGRRDMSSSELAAPRSSRESAQTAQGSTSDRGRDREGGFDSGFGERSYGTGNDSDDDDIPF